MSTEIKSIKIKVMEKKVKITPRPSAAAGAKADAAAVAVVVATADAKSRRRLIQLAKHRKANNRWIGKVVQELEVLRIINRNCDKLKY